MELTLFVSQKLESSSNPGVSVNQITLSGLRGPNPTVPGPNDALFGDLQQQVNVMIQGLKPEVQSTLSSGKKFKMVLTEIVDDPI